MASVKAPPDWYRTAFAGTADMPWTDNTVREVDRALAMLQAQPGERVLDLACGTGRHSLELRRRGFEVIGFDLSPDLLEIAQGDAAEEGLEVSFIEGDMREMDFGADYDIVLSLNDGAIGYFETEQENMRSFEVIAGALRQGGRNLMQLPNVLHAMKHLPQRTFIEGERMIELTDHRWNERARYLEGWTMPVRVGEVFEGVEPIPFRQRLYTLEELDEILASVGMALQRVFRGNGRERAPSDSQFEVFVQSAKL